MAYNLDPSPFGPIKDKTHQIDATSTSDSITLTTVSGVNSNTCWVHNDGSSTAFLRFDKGAATAIAPTSSTSGDFPVAAGFAGVISKGAADTVAAVCLSGKTTTIYITEGEGI